MSENSNKSDDQSSKKTYDSNVDMLAISKYYTKGDLEKAESMVTGEYKDLYIFKIKISSSHIYGACLIFFNHIFYTITDIIGIITESYSADDIKPQVDWIKFEEEILNNLNKEKHDNMNVLNMLKMVKEGFTPNFGKSLITLLISDNTDDFSHKFRNEIFNKLQLQNMKIDVEYEQVSSLDMELLSQSSVKLTPEQLEGDYSEDQESEEDDTSNLGEIIPLDLDTSEKELFDEKKIQQILDGALILSPIKGMHINGLVVGDQIKIKITDKTKTAILIARAFNAYTDGKMRAILGEIVSYRHKAEGGYKMFVEIADGIFIRIDETEENIKVDFAAPSKDRDAGLQKNIETYVDEHIKKSKKIDTSVKKMINQKENQLQKESNIKIIIIAAVIFTFFLLLIFALISN